MSDEHGPALGSWVAAEDSDDLAVHAVWVGQLVATDNYDGLYRWLVTAPPTHAGASKVDPEHMSSWCSVWSSWTTPLNVAWANCVRSATPAEGASAQLDAEDEL